METPQQIREFRQALINMDHSEYFQAIGWHGSDKEVIEVKARMLQSMTSIFGEQPYADRMIFA